jgi:hypothetical protein
MRTECLPDRQVEYNAFLNRKLKALLTVTVLFLLGSVAALAALYFRGTHESYELPHVLANDGATILGNAVPLTPTLLLAEGEMPEASQVQFPSGEKMPATRVRVESVTANTRFSLLRINAPVGMPVLGAIENGQRATARSPQGQWEGTLAERKPGAWYDTQPALLWGPGIPVYGNDGTLIGVTAREKDAEIVVSMTEILTRFPEAKAGQ